MASIRILDLETGGVRELRVDGTSGACAGSTPSDCPLQVPLWLPDGRLVSEGTLGLRLWGLADGSSQQLRACRDIRTVPPRLGATSDSRTVLTLIHSTPGLGETSTLTSFEIATCESWEITWHGNRVSAFALAGYKLEMGPFPGWATLPTW